MTLTYPAVRTSIKKAFADLAGQFGDVDMIAGVATAGVAHGALLADTLDLPYIYVRGKAKGHGRQNLIEGEVRPGARVLVVEDLISTGGSSIAAVQALRDAGMIVVGVIAIFNYGFDKAVDNFKNADCTFATLCDYQALLTVAEEMDYISKEEKSQLKVWSSNPQNWSDEQTNK
jgi:orotate phosphoribosyltransferase